MLNGSDHTLIIVLDNIGKTGYFILKLDILKLIVLYNTLSKLDNLTKLY